MVRLAVESDAPSLGKSFMRAYDDDPVWRWITPSDDYLGRTMIFFTGAIRHGILVDQATYTTDDGVSAAVWTPPRHGEPTQAQIEALTLACNNAFGANLDRFEQTFALMDTKHPHEPHWYLAGLATHPDWQGKGFASRLMQPILDQCDAEGLPAYLEATKEKNVAFYARHGFKLTGTIYPPGGCPPLYLMWREPQRDGR